MASMIELRGITKTYPGVKALDDVSIEVRAGEFFTLLGPSGCGKTTLLRIIAGFIRQDAGRVLLNGACIDGLPAYRRDTGMVFQDNAVFPHMNVGDNVAFGLRTRKVARDEIGDRVAEALQTVRLSAYERRMPHELSGGQQQRVGLARAMVIRPQVLLMDEPLSNLDAKLRIELREEIRDIQKRLSITTVYVTHDQEEALVISDRMCVMQAGKVEQVGGAWEVYKLPATHFVASFVGSMNFFTRIAGTAGTKGLPAGAERLDEAARRFLDGESGSIAAIRPEDMLILTDGKPAQDTLEIEVVIRKISFTGREAQYLVQADDGIEIAVHIPRPSRHLLDKQGATIRVGLPVRALLFFDARTERRL